MAVRLNRQAFEHAKDLIAKGMFVADQRDAWSEHQPSAVDGTISSGTRLRRIWKMASGLNDEKEPGTQRAVPIPCTGISSMSIVVRCCQPRAEQDSTNSERRRASAWDDRREPALAAGMPPRVTVADSGHQPRTQLSMTRRLLIRHGPCQAPAWRPKVDRQARSRFSATAGV